MEIDTKAQQAVLELESSNKNAVFICSTDFDDWYTLWVKVIHRLKELGFKVRRISTHGTIANSTNSDGDGAWDEPWSRDSFFLTKF